MKECIFQLFLGDIKNTPLITDHIMNAPRHAILHLPDEKIWQITHFPHFLNQHHDHFHI